MQVNKRRLGPLVGLMLLAPLWSVADQTMQVTVHIPGQITTTQAATLLTSVQNQMSPQKITVTGQHTIDALTLTAVVKVPSSYDIYWGMDSLQTCSPNQSPQPVKGETFSVYCDQGDHKTYIPNTITLLPADATNPKPRMKLINDYKTTYYECSVGATNGDVRGIDQGKTGTVYWIAARNSSGYLNYADFDWRYKFKCNFPKR